MSVGDSYIPELGNSGYDVTHYTLRLAVDPATEYVEGNSTIDALSSLPGLSRLSLDFTGFEIAAVAVDGRAADYWEEDKKLVIQLPEVLAEEQPFTIDISYHGFGARETSPYVQFLDHLGLHFPDGKSVYVVSEPDGARYWYPANDHPKDKATYRFEITVPISLTAVANGTLVDVELDPLTDGRTGRKFIWEHNKPMAPYLALLAVGDYERLDGLSPNGVLLRHYVFPDLKNDFLDATNDVGRAIDWMSDLLGPYPFDEFGYVTASVPGASMEAQTLVLLSEGMIGSRTAVHELAHMWFGDWVSLESWNEMWRNEGFATYFQYMWATGDDPEALDQHMASVAAAVEENDQNYPLNYPPPEYLFEFDVYQRGSLLVHALRREIGDEGFLRGLRLYFDRYGGGTASDADFRAVMEEASGEELDAFFDGWFPPN
jgi:aminopeptidase N